MLLVKIKASFDKGIEKLRWFANILGERLRVEAAVIKLLGESGDLEKKRTALAAGIGERVFEVRQRKGVNPLKDSRVAKALTELEALDKEIEELKSRASSISRIDYDV